MFFSSSMSCKSRPRITRKLICSGLFARGSSSVACRAFIVVQYRGCEVGPVVARRYCPKMPRWAHSLTRYDIVLLFFRQDIITFSFLAALLVAQHRSFFFLPRNSTMYFLTAPVAPPLSVHPPPSFFIFLFCFLFFSVLTKMSCQWWPWPWWWRRRFRAGILGLTGLVGIFSYLVLYVVGEWAISSNNHRYLSLTWIAAVGSIHR